jgi:hypothetical protein
VSELGNAGDHIGNIVVAVRRRTDLIAAAAL